MELATWLASKLAWMNGSPVAYQGCAKRPTLSLLSLPVEIIQLIITYSMSTNASPPYMLNSLPFDLVTSSNLRRTSLQLYRHTMKVLRLYPDVRWSRPWLCQCRICFGAQPHPLGWQAFRRALGRTLKASRTQPDLFESLSCFVRARVLRSMLRQRSPLPSYRLQWLRESLAAEAFKCSSNRQVRFSILIGIFDPEISADISIWQCIEISICLGILMLCISRRSD